MKKPSIYRKRFIPYEIVDISSDILVYRDEELLVTKWQAIRPRNDFYGGISFVFLKEGFKLGQFYNEAGEFLFWYCDIIDIIYDENTDTYTFEDLLVDIKIMPGGCMKVLDTDELAEAFEKGLVSGEQVVRALRKLDSLLGLIYKDQFPPDKCKQFSYRGSISN